MTTITVIGAGNIGSAVASIGIKAGAQVQVIDRNRDKAEAIEGAKADGFGSPITGNVVVLALPYAAYADVLSTYAPQLAGKTVVDPSNPIDFGSFGLALPQGVHSAAEELAARLPESTVVKAFNTTFAATLAAGTVNGSPTSVMVASDDADAKALVSSVVTAAGLRALDAGPLARASSMEGMGALQIILGATGQTPWTGGFAIVR
jgi:predicted dinucleotide-binding enzyme